MTFLNLPKNPKIEDLIGLLTNLDERVTALEQYVGHNDQRITQLETTWAQVAAERTARIQTLEAASTERQTEINLIRQELNRSRWQQRFKRIR